MKRDMDQVRAILFAIEDLTPSDAGRAFHPDQFSQADLDAHMPIMIDRGLIEAKDWSSLSKRSWGMVRLTWEGHDFLDSVRDDDIWKATKEGVKQAGGFSLDLMKALAKGLIKKQIEHHTGVEINL